MLLKDIEKDEMEGKEGATAIISADRDGKIVFWNEETKFPFGYSEGPQWIGSHGLSRDPPGPREIEGINHG